MKIFAINNDRLKSISTRDFMLERDIQNLVEKNLDELFGLQFVKSELSIKNFRIDTLGYSAENRSFVIIEYKKDRNYSVIDQGYTYMSIMLNNKSDFILEYNENCNATLKREDVDWSQSKVIFISPQFTDYQKNSINFKDVPFELWEIKRYENNIIGLVQHKTTSEESISTVSSSDAKINQVSKEIKVFTEDYHLYEKSKKPEWVIERYKTLRERILSLGEVEKKIFGTFISFRKTSTFTDIVIYQKGLYIIINMEKGTLNDPNKLVKSYDGKGHWGKGDYYIIVDSKTDLDYVMYIINQSYKNQENK